MKLRLGPLPKTEVTKLTVTISIVLREQLEQYAELHAAEHGRVAAPELLAAQILQQFIARDRAFQKALRGRASPRPSSMRSNL